MRTVVTARRLLAHPTACESFRSSELPFPLGRPDPPSPRYPESVRKQAAWQAERGGYSPSAIFEPFMRWLVVNGLMWRAGKYGNEISLDETDDYVSPANPSTFNFGTNDFAIRYPRQTAPSWEPLLCGARTVRPGHFLLAFGMQCLPTLRSGAQV